MLVGNLNMNNPTSERCCVVIPIYKKTLSKYELHSFKQCIKILGNHHICLITHNDLDISFYLTILNKTNAHFSIKYFSPNYFDSVLGYNLLLLSNKFYSSFLEFEYILIYQLDAYVFFDNIDYWCTQEYDYIGAYIPEFIIQNNMETYNSCHTEPLKLRYAYNGGASLRKVSTFYRITTDFSCLITELSNAGLNEDIIFSSILYNSNQPTKETADSFSIESFPKESYLSNGKKLPMLCHGWYRDDLAVYDKEFWFKHIMYFEYMKLQIHKLFHVIKRLSRKLLGITTLSSRNDRNTH